MKNADDLILHLNPVRSERGVNVKEDTLGNFAVRQVASAIVAADEFSKNQKQSNPADSTKYPDTKLAGQLKFISQLIRGDSSARVFYAIQSGYDTHYDQLGDHGRLLREFSNSLKAFLDDLRASRLEDRVVVLAFSEFGRRVQENDSKGTDHGIAGPVFLAGSSIRGGQVGQLPSLTDLAEGDLKPLIDFRQVYASILDQWLKIPSRKVLGDNIKGLDLFKA